MAKTKPDHDRDRDPADNDNDPNQAVAVPPTAGALASLASLGAVLNAVDTASVAGRSGLPMLQFKRDGNGTWSFGQKKTITEEGSRWAVNPTTFRRGFICFDDSNRVVGERLVTVAQEMPNVAELPDNGFKWNQQWSVNLKCIDGTDAGVEVVYKPTTVGGIQAIAGLIEAIRDRLNSGQHNGQVSPIVLLDRDSYPHQQYGKVWTPVLTIVAWMTMDGPEPAPAPTPEPKPSPSSVAEQPRRRRVAG